ncbi:MAG: hypothetical protein C0518_08835 [Opitutus sp.]|nr:hypothetical protein [Opitutus sp.]
MAMALIRRLGKSSQRQLCGWEPFPSRNAPFLRRKNIRRARPATYADILVRWHHTRYPTGTMKLLRTLVTLATLGFAATSLSAQMVGGTVSTPPATGSQPTAPRMDPAMGATLKAIVDSNRAAIQTILDQRKTLLEQLKNATPEQRDAIRSQLQQLMRETHAAQRDLAKAIRDAIKARRDQARPTPPPGG